jgi:hypothetical protein
MVGTFLVGVCSIGGTDAGFGKSSKMAAAVEALARV